LYKRLAAMMNLSFGSNSRKITMQQNEGNKITHHSTGTDGNNKNMQDADRKLASGCRNARPR
jgi:hypothetical protein